MGDARFTEQLLAYLPLDRTRAVLLDQDLPEHVSGSVLFADISGFTPLTEAFVTRYGPRRGGEEFTDKLNAVYDAIIAPVLRYGGSIMSFAGDAFSAFFNGDNGARACTAAFEMQAAMRQFRNMVMPGREVVSLGMKVSISSGDLRRFVCGDPEIQRLDILTGNVMERMANGEGVARSGEIVVDERTARQLGDRLQIESWRDLPADLEPRSVAIAKAFEPAAEPAVVEIPPLPDDADERLRPWLIPEVFERLVSGQNIFLTELRPAAALFARFSGIAFETDPEAPRKLHEYLQWVQRVITRVEGVMLQVTIGDKGSYFYAAFGAPVAHDDDSARAMTAALEIAHPPAEIADLVPTVQIGVTRGTMRTGAYGGQLRRTYGVLGDDVNLAARLMKAAGPNEILVGSRATHRQGDSFDLVELEPIQVKGKARPVAVHRLVGRRSGTMVANLDASRYATPMIGRREELALAVAKLEAAAAGRGQLIAISAEAGMGKTRLLSEVVREAASRGFRIYAGDCPVLAHEASYTVWAPIWRAILELGSETDPAVLLELISRYLARIDPELAPRAPLLGSVLNIALPDNDLTRTLDARTRRASVEGLLVECLKHRAADSPLTLVLEECHWIDEASRSLLATIVRAIERLPVAIALAHRPVASGEILSAEDEGADHVTAIELGNMPPSDARALIELELGKVFGPERRPPTALVELINSRAQGNPFFIEEVANLIESSGFDRDDPRLLEKLELPASLHSLVLSRIDQLTQDTQTTLKVASVIGRIFRAAMVFGVHPVSQRRELLPEHLQELCRQEIATPEPVEGEEAYLFKHIVIQEVAYESLPFALRATIHEAIGTFVEQIAGEDTRRWIDLLAFHFERSRREDKKRHYLLAAAEAARDSYAIKSAISYYRRVLDLLRDEERIDVLQKLGEALEIAGQWDEAFSCYSEARDLALKSGTAAQQASSAAAIGDFHRKRGDFAEAGDWLARARKEFTNQGDELGAAHILHLEGTLSAQSGNFARAAALFHQALAVREKLGDDANAAKTLNNLGIVARSQGDVPTALEYYQRSLEIRRRIDDKREIANSLNNLGFAHRFLGEFDKARSLLEESVKINRTVGDRWATANALTSLAELALDTNDAPTAREALRESIGINRDLGDKRALAFLLEACGHLWRIKDQPADALVYFSAARQLRDTIGAPLEPADAEKLEAILSELRQSLAPETCAAAEAEGRERPLNEILDRAIA